MTVPKMFGGYKSAALAPKINPLKPSLRPVKATNNIKAQRLAPAVSRITTIIDKNVMPIAIVKTNSLPSLSDNMPKVGRAIIPIKPDIPRAVADCISP